MASPTHIMITSTECEAGREAEFHDWYDTVHIPDLLAIPGVVSAKRYASTASEGNRWLAIYELEGDLAKIQEQLAEAVFERSPYYLRERTQTSFYTMLKN